MRLLCTIPLLTTLFLAACSKDPAPAPKGDQPKAGDPHGEQVDLGKAKIGDFEIVARRNKDMKAGDEGHIDLEFLAGKQPPATVRGWIGVQDATGSVKAAFPMKTGDHASHGHIEVPKPIPAGSKLWVEIEVGGTKTTGSFDLKL